MSKMWTLLRIVFLLLCVEKICFCLTITEGEAPNLGGLAPDSTQEQELKEMMAKYRVSTPKIKSPTNRVPSHLQGIHSGYVYDDADDVIHIIEPPKHFQQLKRLINQNGEAAVWEQQSKVRFNRPQAIATPPAPTTIRPILNLQKPKVVEHNRPQVAKVEKWPHRLRNTKPAVAAVKNIHNNNNNGGAGGKLLGDGDLLTEETQLQPAGNSINSINSVHQLSFPPKLPVEILASVRKTERLLHQQRLLVPHANSRQRLKSMKTHTVIMEKGYQREQFKRGQEHRLGSEKLTGGKVRKTRTKRDLRKSLETSNRQKSLNSKSDGKIAASIEQSKVKRASVNREPALLKLEINSGLESAKQAYREILELKQGHTKKKVSHYDQKKGHKLLLHITELLKNATEYLPDEVTVEQLNASTKAHSSTLEELQRRFQYDTQPKQLIGEIEPTKSTVALEENDLYKILENSVNATDAIMQEIMRRKNSSQDCGSDLSSTSPRKRFQHLQSRIECMRKRILTEAEDSVTNFSTRGKQRFGQRIGEKVSAQLVTTTRRFPKTKSPEASKTPSHRSQKSVSIPVYTKVISSEEPSTLDDRNISASLLYDDVMTNIRNMLQAKNLKLLEEEEQQETASTGNITSSLDGGEGPSDEFGDFSDLSQYLNELQQIVERLPALAPTLPANVSSSTTELTLNSREFTSSSPKPSDWYLINGKGKIYQTHLNGEQQQFQRTVSMFHRFPDIPNASDYLRNRTLRAEPDQSHEMF